MSIAGIEKNFRSYSQNSTGTFNGLGAPGGTTATIEGCNLEPNVNMGGTCTSTGNGNTKQIFQLTGGFWDKIYKGSFGEVRGGVQYQFNERQIYNNVFGGTVAANGYTPKAFGHAVLTSLRYYPFQ